MAKPNPERKTKWPYYWDRRIETMPRKELQELQDKKIRYIVRWAWENSQFHRKLWEEKAPGVTPSDIKGYADLTKLPIYVKNDIRAIEAESPPFGPIMSLPDSYLYKLCASTGTTGRPTYNVWTPTEEEYGRDIMDRCWWTMMMRPGDVYYCTWRLDYHYTWGVRFYKASLRMGMKVIPVGSCPIGTTPQILKDFVNEVRPTVIGGTPSGMYSVALMFKEWGIEPPFEVVHTAGEPLPRDARKRLQEIFNTEYVFDFYGISEQPALFCCECDQMVGDHWWHDASAFEIIDPDTEERLAANERGILVMTSLINHTFPMIRFNIEDTTYYVEDLCPCGRTHYLFPIGIPGRQEWLVKVKGKYFLPWDVENVVRKYISDLKEYQIIKDTPLEHPYIHIKLEPQPDKVPKNPDDWVKEWEAKLSEELGAPVKIDYTPPGGIPAPIWKKTYVIHKWKEKKA